MKEVDYKPLFRELQLRFKEIRAATGLTQKDVLTSTGIHIGRLESTSPNISLKTLVRLSEFYRVSPSVLCGSKRCSAEATSGITPRSLGLALRQIRKERGIQVATAADHTGIHIARLETGKANVTFRTLLNVACYYDVTLCEILRLAETEKAGRNYVLRSSTHED